MPMSASSSGCWRRPITASAGRGTGWTLSTIAETHGHDQDRPRSNAWPYRDYLIRAFNADKPYARFVQEQIAGDVLFPNEPQGNVATGFLATGPWDESSLRDIREDTLDRQVGRYLDRDDMVTTVMSTFVSTTVHCARCHDHKFDPISQEEYYALQAVFAGTDKADRAYDPEPRVAARRRPHRTQGPSGATRRTRPAPRRRPVAGRGGGLGKEPGPVGGGVATARSRPNGNREAGATLSKLADGSLLSGGKRPEKDTYTVIAPTDVQGITGLRLEVLTDDSLPHKGPGRQDNGNLHLNEFTVTAAPQATVGRTFAQVGALAKADFDQQGWTLAHALDGNAATAWGIYPQVGKSHQAVFTLAEPLRQPGGLTLTVTLRQTHGGGHLIGRLRLSLTTAHHPEDLAPLPPPISTILGVTASQRTPRQRADLAAYYLGGKLDHQLAALPPRRLVYCGTNSFVPDGSFAPSKTPRPVRLLKRGDILKPGAPVAPGTLSCVSGLEHRFRVDPKNEGERRAALARWLSDPANVLDLALRSPIGCGSITSAAAWWTRPATSAAWARHQHTPNCSTGWR